MRPSLTLFILIIGFVSSKYVPFEDLTEKFHVEISDFTAYAGGTNPHHLCFDDSLWIDITIRGVDVRRQAINFYDYGNLCCEDDKPVHRPLD